MFYIYFFQIFLHLESINSNRSNGGQSGNKKLSLDDNSENLVDELISSENSLPGGDGTTVATVAAARPGKTKTTAAAAAAGSSTTATDTVVSRVYGNQPSVSSEANEIANDNSGRRRDWANQDLLSSTATTTTTTAISISGDGLAAIAPTGKMRRCNEADSESNNKRNKTSNTLACRLIEVAGGTVSTDRGSATTTRFHSYDERAKAAAAEGSNNPLGTPTGVIDEDRHRHQQHQSSMTNNPKVGGGNQFTRKEHATTTTTTTSSMTTCRPLVYRSIEWPPTSAGMTAVRPCPADTVGEYTHTHTHTSAENVGRGMLLH